jgi:DNA polymerase I-like protein with 3'-5' exonuclease and polymerase domains
MTNVTKLRGRPLPIAGREIPAYVTYATSTVLAGGIQYQERILEDLKRAGEKRLEYPVDARPSNLPAIAVDTEYAPNGELLTVGVANDNFAVSDEPGSPEYEDTLGCITNAGKGALLVGHSLSGDVDHLVKLGLARPEWVNGTRTWDSLLLSRMHDENRGVGGYELESLLTSSHNVEPWKYKTKAYDKADATTWPVELRKERCRLDAWASSVVAGEAALALQGSGQPVELTHRIAMSLHRIELAGVYIDQVKFNKMELELAAEVGQYQDQLTKMAQSHGMTSFTPTKDADIRELLFKRLKLDPVKKTKNGQQSVDKVTLKQYEHVPEVSLLMKFNAADKALSVNITGVKPLIQDDGYMPVHINPLGAKTGRRSSSEPNMQNWPEMMRQLVISRYPGGCILEFDYKSLEAFIISFIAKEEKLYDYFANRGGYIGVAKEMWGEDIVKGSKKYKGAKSIQLGTFYNMQTPLMAQNLWYMGVRFSEDYDDHERQTDKLRNKFLDMFPKLRTYMDAQKRYLLKHESARSLTGRVRHLPLSDGRDTPGFGRLVNQAINYPIQSLAADVTGSALLDCEAALCKFTGLTLPMYHEAVLLKKWRNDRIPLVINEIHDSLVFDLPYPVDSERTKEVKELLTHAMEEVRTLRGLVPEFTLPLKVEAKLGLHWGTKDE